jgi:hypothetical protein
MGFGHGSDLDYGEENVWCCEKMTLKLTAEAQRFRRGNAEKTIVLKVFSALPLRLCASAVGF